MEKIYIVTAGDSFRVNVSGNYYFDITVPAAPNNTVGKIVEAINDRNIGNLTAVVEGGLMKIYYGEHDQDRYLQLTSLVGTALDDLGISETQYFAPEIVFGPSAEMPLWSASQSRPHPTGSVWIKSSSAGAGLDLSLSKYSSTTGTWSNKTVNAYAADSQATALLESYGLTGNIGPGITALFQAGLDSTTIQTILNSPNPQSAINGLGLSGNAAAAAQNLVGDWQARFSGNQARIKQGLAPLDPATYIQYEQTYKQLLSSAGVANTSPLMDTNYIGQLIGADVSAAEMQQRVNAAQNVIQNESLSEDDKMIQFKLSFEKIRQINIDIVIDGIDSITTEEEIGRAHV